MSRLLRLLQRAIAICTCLVSFAGVATAQDYSSSFRYDALHRLTGQIDADPDGGGPLQFPAVRYTWSVDGQLVRIEKGVLQARPAATVAPANWSNFTVQQQTAIAYDVRGLQTEERVSANGQLFSVTQYSYDADGRLACSAVRMDLGNVPAAGSSACSGTAVGPDRITRTIYDTADEVLQVRRGVGTPLEQAYTTFTYTPNGDREYVIDAVGNRARFTYDGFGRKLRWWFPVQSLPTGFDPSNPASAVATAGAVSGNLEYFSYDENDNLVNHKMRDGRSVVFSYDSLNRRYRKRYRDVDGNYDPSRTWVFYGYDLRGLQTYARYGATDGEGISSTYDGAGRLTQSTDDVGGTTLSLQYLYDLASNRIRVTHPDGKFFIYGYDRLSRATTIKENGTTNTLATISYDDTGQRSGVVRSNGTSTSYDYFDIPRLKTLAHDLTGTTRDVTFGFAYNPAGQTKTGTRSNTSYAFVPPGVSTQSYVRNGLNQYASVSGTAFGYDDNGNLTSDGASTFTYDVENRLLSATGFKTATLTYDPIGRLHSTKGPSASSETRFLYDGDALVAEYDANGLLQRRYVHGPGIDEPMVWYEGSTIAATARRFTHADRQGSIIGINDDAGASIAVNRYDSWGVADPGNLGRFQYTGQIAIPELGMYHYKARVYAPQLGRFLQTDPVGYDDQINLYAYVANDPVNHADPSGKQAAQAAQIAARACASNATCASTVATAAVTLAAAVGLEGLTKADNRPSVNVDTNVLINVLDKPGTPAAANASGALAGRVAMVSPTAADEYINGKGSPPDASARLGAMLASGAARIAPPGSLIEVGKLMAVNGLKYNDAQIVAAGTALGLKTLTSDVKTLASKVPDITETYRPTPY